jgi:hypothetical protein
VSAVLGPRSGITSAGSNLTEDGGRRLNLRPDVPGGDGVGLVGGALPRLAFAGILKCNCGLDGSSSSFTASDMLGGREDKLRLDMRTTLERLCPRRREPLLLGLVCVARVCIASCGSHWKGFGSSRSRSGELSGEGSGDGSFFFRINCALPVLSLRGEPKFAG